MTFPLSTAIPLPQISLAGTSVGTGYTLIGTFASELDIIKFTNTTDGNILISFDGITDHLFLANESSFPVYVIFNFRSNGIILPPGPVYAKQSGTAPTQGSVYVGAFASKVA